MDVRLVWFMDMSKVISRSQCHHSHHERITRKTIDTCVELCDVGLKVKPMPYIQ